MRWSRVLRLDNFRFWMWMALTSLRYTKCSLYGAVVAQRNIDCAALTSFRYRYTKCSLNGAVVAQLNADCAALTSLRYTKCSLDGAVVAQRNVDCAALTSLSCTKRSLYGAAVAQLFGLEVQEGRGTLDRKTTSGIDISWLHKERDGIAEKFLSLRTQHLRICKHIRMK